MKDAADTTGFTVFTVGHSNHPLETFLALIEQYRIGLIVDVRSSPYSAYVSEFNKEAARTHLASRGVGYLFLGDLLGGRPEGEEFYDEEGYVLYDRLAQSPRFQRGIGRLLDRIRSSRAALLCGEEDPTQCHRRRLVGRVLGERGVNVLHIRGDGHLQSEEEVAKQERFRKTKGQMTLFDLEEAEPWRSTRSVSPRNRQPNSSGSSDEPGSGV
jgi:uncharacterized protein (DUF488 family)